MKNKLTLPANNHEADWLRRVGEIGIIPSSNKDVEVTRTIITIRASNVVIERSGRQIGPRAGYDNIRIACIVVKWN